MLDTVRELFGVDVHQMHDSGLSWYAKTPLSGHFFVDQAPLTACDAPTLLKLMGAGGAELILSAQRNQAVPSNLTALERKQNR